MGKVLKSHGEKEKKNTKKKRNRDEGQQSRLSRNFDHKVGQHYFTGGIDMTKNDFFRVSGGANNVGN